MKWPGVQCETRHLKFELVTLAPVGVQWGSRRTDRVVTAVQLHSIDRLHRTKCHAVDSIGTMTEAEEIQMTTEVEGALIAVHKKPVPGKSRWRRGVVASTALFGILLTGTAVLPTLLMQTALRDQVLGSAIQQQNWTTTSGEASGGWLAPLIFRDVRISDSEGRFLCTIRELKTSKGLLAFLTDDAEVGRIDLIDPHVEVHMDEDGKWPACESKPSRSRLAFAVENGSLVVTVPWRKTPIVDIDELILSGKIGPDTEGRRMLTVNAAQIFDHEPLSDAHTTQNLALIAPVLSQSTSLSGSASVWIDKVEIPLEGDQKSPFPILGRAEFHSLEARLKEAWTRQLAAVTGQLTGRELPDRVEVMQDSRVDFVITDEGVTHKGMVFLLPEIAQDLRITSSGMIRLDESLDLQLTVAVPKIVLADNPVMAILGQLAAAPLQLNVKGTVSKPEIQLPQGTDLLGEISRRVTPAQHQEEAPAVPTTVIGLLQDVSNPDKAEAQKNLPGNILNLIRAIDRGAKDKAKDKPRRTRQKD